MAIKAWNVHTIYQRYATAVNNYNNYAENDQPAIHTPIANAKNTKFEQNDRINLRRRDTCKSYDNAE